MISLRKTFLAGFLLTIAMMLVAFFMQYYMELEPCPLCSSQRAVVIALGIVFLVAFIHNPSSWGKRVYGLILTALSMLALAIAGRHTWLQHLPEDKIPECGPGLDFWISHLPAIDVIQKIFQGSGECAEVVFNFLGLSIPEWSVIAFIPLFIYSLKLLVNGRFNSEVHNF